MLTLMQKRTGVGIPESYSIKPGDIFFLGDKAC